ncbi:hypothetical protein VNI00_005624 [Paramarasmius palmivorus]|uniref:Uncharacterized protein n=1 Tax=Paramarasmius palmivorus TaxID=297713 RepID=A0AAW0DDP4_9AGAR
MASFYALANSYPHETAPTVFNELKVMSGNRPVELIQGIKHDGSFELLITRDEEEYFWRRKKIRVRRWNDEDFQSLSPIQFASAEDLKKKMIKLGKDAKKHKDSQSLDGVYKGQYECGRLYRMIALDNIKDYARFGITQAVRSQLLAARIKSFTYTRWSRRNPNNPRAIEVLDMGISEADTNSLSPVLNATVRFKNTQNSGLKQAGFREADTFGTQHPFDRDTITERLNDFFSISSGEAPSVIILVHNEEGTRQVLKDFNVDTRHIVSGTKKLFYPERTRYQGREGTARPRIYLLDLQKIYQILYRTPNDSASVKEIANRTRVTSPCSPEEWNAGNDAKYMIDIWKRFTYGLSINEEYEAINREEQHTLQQAALPAPLQTVDDDDDDDIDPNSIQAVVPGPTYDYDDAPSDDEE